MHRRSWLWLAGAVLALALAYFFVSSRPPAGSSAGGPLFSGFDREQAQKIEVRGKEGDGIVLQKGSAAWTVPSDADYAADPEGLREVFEFVSGAQGGRKVSENPGKRAVYEVGEGGLNVRISGAEDATLAHFVIGKPGPDFMSTYLRPEGSDAVYLVDQSLRRIFVRPGARQWRDKAVYRLSGPDIVKMKWTREGGSVALEADSSGNWTLTAPAAAAGKRDEIEALRNALSTLQCDDFAIAADPKTTGLGPAGAQGAAKPWARLEFTMRDGTAHTLDVGAENDHSQRHVRRSGSDTIFLVNNFRINTIFKSADDLKAPPPAPDATPSAPEQKQEPAPAGP